MPFPPSGHVRFFLLDRGASGCADFLICSRNQSIPASCRSVRRTAKTSNSCGWKGCPRICKLRLANARVLSVGAASASFIGAEIAAAPPLDGVGVASIVLPALAIWLAAAFAAMWLNVAFMHASVDAYQRVGAPPLFDFAR